MEIIKKLKERFKRIRLMDMGKKFNTELVELLELRSLLDFTELIVAGARARTESRGAHYRDDYPETDNHNWLKHHFIRESDGQLKVETGPVDLREISPDGGAS